ncbi:MAG: hypothetical protein AAF658_06785, partial [Myxococcota bacterium]
AGRCSIDRGDISALGAAVGAIRTALDQVDATIDFRDFDTNGPTAGTPDGVVDGVIFLSNIDFGGIALPHVRVCELLPSFCPDTSWDSVYDNTLVPWVAIAAASNGDLERANYVAIHEYGHLLGFADLYDESFQTTDLPYSFMGGWNYDDRPDMPAGPSRIDIGWANVQTATTSGTYSLRPSATSGDVLVLGSGNEFFVAEVREANGVYDGSIAESGVAIYHVNEARRPSGSVDGFLTLLLDCVNCEPWAPFMMLEQADGLFELQEGPGNRDDSGDLFRAGDTFPIGADGPPLSASNAILNSNRYDGSSTGIGITAFRKTATGFDLDVVVPGGGDASGDGGSEDSGCAATPGAGVYGLLLGLTRRSGSRRRKKPH